MPVQKLPGSVVGHPIAPWAGNTYYFICRCWRHSRQQGQTLTRNMATVIITQPVTVGPPSCTYGLTIGNDSNKQPATNHGITPVHLTDL